MKIYLLALLLLFTPPFAIACGVTSAQDTPSISFPAKGGSDTPEKDYIYQTLKIAVALSEDKYGPCEVKLKRAKFPLKRALHYLQQGEEIDVIALTATNERDKEYLPVKIPLAKGMIGYRVLVIRTEQIEKFNTITSGAQLRELIAGQGTGWPDVDILRNNGYEVVTVGSIDTLIDMLRKGRFDYFPQGPRQLANLIDFEQDDSVVIAPKVLIKYPGMTIFYVKKDNHALAARLTYGLQKAYDTGAFEQHFNQHPSMVNALSALSLKQKKLITLCNTETPNWAPLEQDKLWLTSWYKNGKFIECD